MRKSYETEMIMDALFVVVGMKHEVLQSYDEFCNKVSKCLWEIRGNTEMKYFFCGNNDQWMMVFQSE